MRLAAILRTVGRVPNRSRKRRHDCRIFSFRTALARRPPGCPNKCKASRVVMFEELAIAAANSGSELSKSVMSSEATRPSVGEHRLQACRRRHAPRALPSRAHFAAGFVQAALSLAHPRSSALQARPLERHRRSPASPSRSRRCVDLRQVALELLERDRHSDASMPSFADDSISGNLATGNPL